MEKSDWVVKVVLLIQMFLTLGGRCNRYFWDIRLNILRLPNFNMLFQFVVTKFVKKWLFSCLPTRNAKILVLEYLLMQVQISFTSEQTFQSNNIGYNFEINYQKMEIRLWDYCTTFEQWQVIRQITRQLAQYLCEITRSFNTHSPIHGNGSLRLRKSF